MASARALTDIRFAPYWWDAAEPSSQPRQALQRSCDVAIIGAGYTGLSAACELAKHGRSVQVFEKELAGHGASTRNGGILSGNIRISPSSAIRRWGEAKASALYREGIDARAYVAALIGDHGIDCDFQMAGRFTGAMNQADLDSMTREAELLEDLVGIETRVIGKSAIPDEIGSSAYVGGVVRPDIGLFHPAKFHRGLLSLAREAGAVIHDETPVLGMTRVAGKFEIATPRGKVTVGDVIVATNGYGDGFDPWLRRRIIPIRSRIVVTEELPEDLMRQLMPHGRAMGETRKTSRYYRATPDGKRLMLGSRDPALPTTPVKAAAHVRRELLDIFPELKDARITYSWAGNVAFTLSDLPLLFTRDRAHYAVGYCGSGAVWAPWLGRKAARAILRKGGRETMLANQAPSALPFYRGRPWFLPAVMAYYGIKDWRKARKLRR